MVDQSLLINIDNIYCNKHKYNSVIKKMHVFETGPGWTEQCGGAILTHVKKPLVSSLSIKSISADA